MEDDQQRYIETLQSDDPMVITIKGALIIEYRINSIIENLTHSTKALRRADFEFHQRLNLLIALGFPERFYKPIMKFAQIRNKYAHNLHYELDRKIVIEFYNTFSAEDQEIFQNSYKKTAQGKDISRDPLRLEPVMILKLCFTTLRGALIIANRETNKDYIC